MSANDTTYQIILNSNEIKAWTMPDEGFYPDVEIHCWGAGGGSGWGGAPGGGGGYAKTTLNINPGDEVTLQIGQPGRNAPSATGAGGEGGLDTTYRNFRGGNGGARGTWCGQNGGPYPSGGGGGASFVAVEGSFVCVAAGGGGGGGYGHDNFKDPGKPGGVNSGLTNNFRGEDAIYGGGGGAGYLGGASGFASGHTVTGGSGGTNFGNVTVAGSGTLPGGRTTAYYPGDKKGEAGYPGYIVIILRKKFNAFIKNPDASGDWVRANTAYVKTPSQSVTVSQAVGPQTTTYNSVGTNTFTVPAGVTSIQLTVIGGGGGGGGADSSPGSAGRAGARVSGTLAVTPGQVLTVSVGSGGGGGTSDQGSAPGGVGGTNSLGYSGGSGSAAGPAPISGGGGGGGAASAVLVNGSPTVVAAGGGGGGGGGNGVPGQGVSPGGTSGGIAGGAGQPKGGDGGGAGGGGGGYPQGGRGGNVGGGDVGGFSGADGQSLVPAGFSLGQGAAGGIPAIRGSRSSTGGGGGSVTVSYTPAPVNVTVVTGGWRPIEQAFTKVNGLWKPLLTNEPIELYNYPVKRRAVNINIVVPTYNFVVYDNLPVQYFEGLLDVNVYIAANTTVGSTNVNTPALLVDRFSPGDTVKISNYGNIAGRGGDGGAAGSYSVSNGCFPINSMVSTPNGLTAIQDIKIGDLVYAYKMTEELNYSVDLVEKTVTKTFIHSWEEVKETSGLLIFTHEHGTLIVTKNHELLNTDVQNPLSDPGFARADELDVGNSLVLADGTLTKILEIKDGPSFDFVYNLEVDDYHTFVIQGLRVHNGTPVSGKGGSGSKGNPNGGSTGGYSSGKGIYSSGGSSVTSVPGRPGSIGGAALRLDFLTVIENYGTIAGGGGGGGGGGGPTGGQGGGGAGAFPGNGGNNGTLTAGGAGLGLGGAGGAQGTRGTNGTNSSSGGGLGGESGAAVVNIQNATFTVTGTRIGPLT